MTACFVLSTGRCGTQWLAETLQQWSPHFIVEHEPLHLGYRPDCNTPTAPLNANADVLQAHLKNIRTHLAQGKTYIETGFPCWRHLNWYKQQLHDVRVIHIHRDPLDSLHSLLKLNAFVPPLLPHLPVKNLYLPTCDQDYLYEYQHLWPTLSAAEKNLWYWAEVQAQALTYRKEWLSERWLTIRFDDLFSESTCHKLIDFFGCNEAPHWPSTKKVDNFGANYSFNAEDVSRISSLQKIKYIIREFDYELQCDRSCS